MSRWVKLQEQVLLQFSRDPNAADIPGGTLKTDLDTALSFLTKTVPNFLSLIRGRKILDFGCGWGWQAAAMVLHGAASVTGIDISEGDLIRARKKAEEYSIGDRCRFVRSLDSSEMGSFDFVLSCSSFEHFGDPAGILRLMQAAARPGGKVVVSYAEPWYSPHGSHMGFFTNLPWVNLLFSEEAVLRVRSRYRSDGALRYEDVEGGLNRMTLRKFERIIKASGMECEFLGYYPVKGLPVVDKIPVLREVLVSAASCILVKS